MCSLPPVKVFVHAVQTARRRPLAVQGPHVQKKLRLNPAAPPAAVLGMHSCRVAVPGAGTRIHAFKRACELTDCSLML